MLDFYVVSILSVDEDGTINPFDTLIKLFTSINRVIDLTKDEVSLSLRKHHNINKKISIAIS